MTQNLKVGIACTLVDNKEIFIDRDDEFLWIRDLNDHEMKTAVKVCVADKDAVKSLMYALERLIIHT